MPSDRLSRIPLAELLGVAIRWPLPGVTAQARFAPELSFGRHFGPPPASARRAAVLILLYQNEGSRPIDRAIGTAAAGANVADLIGLANWRVPLIVRPEHMEHHAGQIGLPGGIIEADETPIDAACRELQEELGVPRHEIDVLGQLSPLYVYGSNHYVIPHVAISAQSPTFIVNVDEVAEVLELPLDLLLDPAQIAIETREHRGVRFQSPYLALRPHHIWGATAMILGEFAAVLNRAATTE